MDDFKCSLEQLISDTTPCSIAIDAPNEKNDLNVLDRYWPGTISSSLMPSQN